MTMPPETADPEGSRPYFRRQSELREAPEPRRLRGVESVPSPGAVRVHLVLPRSFNDAQQIADRFKDGMLVILNLQGSDQELFFFSSRRRHTRFDCDWSSDVCSSD